MACPHDLAAPPCVEPLVADEAGEVVPAQPSRVRGKVVVAAVIFGMAGTAAILGTRPSLGSKLAEADPQDLQNLWGNYDDDQRYDGDHHGDGYQRPSYARPNYDSSRPNYGNSQNGGFPQTDGHFACGSDSTCTCEWSNPSFCSRRDDPPTPCWHCCCEDLHPAEYHRAISQGGGDDSRRRGGYHPHPDDAEFYPGQHVRVLARNGWWEPASILRQAGPQQYEVRLAHSGRIKYAPEERIAHVSDGGWWPSCWTLLFWGILTCCLIAICVTAVAFVVKSKE